MMLRTPLPLAAILLSFASVAHAETPPGTLIALTPDQVEEAKEEGARRAAKAALDGPARDRAIHGEVGFAIGTGGYRSMYGTAVMPLGDSGMIAISLANEQFDQPIRRIRPR